MMEKTAVRIEDQVLSVLRVLPPVQQREVLDFAEFLQQHRQPTEPGPTATLLPLPVLEGWVPTGWKEAVYDEQ
jgi:hypothetical protein